MAKMCGTLVRCRFVDADVAAVIDEHSGGLGAGQAAAGDTPDRHQDLVEHVAARSRWSLEADPQPVIARFDRGQPGPEVDVLVLAADPPGQRADDVGVPARDELVHQFHHVANSSEMVMNTGTF
jgi:hypothetical protein